MVNLIRPPASLRTDALTGLVRLYAYVRLHSSKIFLERQLARIFNRKHEGKSYVRHDRVYIKKL